MIRQEARPVGEILDELLKAQHLDLKLNETRLLKAWPEVAGCAVAAYTTRLKIVKGVLHVSVSSSVLRQELMMCRQTLLERLNARAGGNVIHEILFR